jgi:DNA-binding CsgD family transcriptional regulator
MGSKNMSVVGLLIYFTMILLLFQLDFKILLRPLDMFLVASGMVILSLSQYRSGWKLADFMSKLKSNALLAGALSSVFMVLGSQELNLTFFSVYLLPSVYGTLIYLCFDFLEKSDSHVTASQSTSPSMPKDWQSPGYLTPYLISQGLSQRECHVAIKLIQGDSNQDIAAQLFIAESTVKKHLQNIYRKLEVSNRQDLIRRVLSAIWGINDNTS